MIRPVALALLAAFAAGSAVAEVTVSGPDSFTLDYAMEVETTPEAAYASMADIGRWWEASHTYSGDAANLSLALAPGGCFCEALPGGGVEHGRVMIAWPERMVRLDAALGPLQEMGVNGVLTFAWTPTPDRPDSLRLSVAYIVNGPGVGDLASAVDQVIGAQVSNWARFIEQSE